ncbi:hypothetical protein AVEN_33151-1 [Araneus ventricosus]|uniref:Uncharacterized protein n=1 Tax=Araneus ventricosus TaxID=182803 RepID=A0A4Y2LHV2_ARAVE|nr:hypothetical protein AVEN_33151-1 [Araneus ventricosus]
MGCQLWCCGKVSLFRTRLSGEFLTYLDLKNVIIDNVLLIYAPNDDILDGIQRLYFLVDLEIMLFTYILAADNGTLIIPKYSCYYNVPLFGIQQSAHEFSSSTRMCPKKCVTPHSGSVAGRTNLSRSQQAANLQERLKGEGGSSPIRPGPHRVQRTDLSYFCGEVRNRCRPPATVQNDELQPKTSLVLLQNGTLI